MAKAKLELQSNISSNTTDTVQIDPSVIHPSNEIQLQTIDKKVNRITWWRRLIFAGPGTFVAIGYIDPGNWATDLTGGSYAGYALLSIVLASSLVAMLLQIMSARLGIATGKDLAEISRETWPQFAWVSWIAAELAIIATDFAEVLRSAIALKLLFSIPLAIGVVLTVFDVLLILS